MDGRHDEDLRIEAPGADEVVVVPWPLLLRERVARRVDASDRRRAIVVWTVLVGVFSVGFTITILSVSLPRIARDLHSDTNTLTWVITGPLLAYGIVGPPLGKAGDVWGHKRLFLLGLCGSVVFASLSASAWSAPSLITFRVLGVAEGAATVPASMALLLREYPDEQRVKAMGWWSLVGAGAPVLGVVAGGPVVEAVGWRAIFVGQVGFTLVALALAALVLPPSERGVRQPMDLPGSAALGLAATGLLFGLNRGAEWGWSSPGVIGAFLLAPVALAAFVVIERRSKTPLIPIDWFGRRNFSLPIAVQFFTNLAYMGSFILTPLFLEQAFGYHEGRAGLLTIARPLAFSITSPVAGYLAVRVGERTAGVVGSLAVVASMAYWTSVTPHSGDWAVVLALGLAGIGLGVSSPSMAASMANAVPDESLGVAGAAQQMVAQVGVVVGIQLAETFEASRRASAGLVPSFQQAYLLLGLISLGGVACALFVRSTPRGAERHESSFHYEAV